MGIGAYMGSLSSIAICYVQDPDIQNIWIEIV